MNSAATMAGRTNAATSTALSRKNRRRSAMDTAILSTAVTPVPSAVQAMIDEARRDPETFWGRAARELPWFRTWDRVFEQSVQGTPGTAGTPKGVPYDAEFQPAFRWFGGGRTNLAYNALDHHVANGRGDHTALIYFNERGEQSRFTYAGLLHEVERVAAALRALGIARGDRVTVYMPTSPEAIMLMLAIVRIGAIHSVV